ncbi:MAG: hypothetical protein ABI415_11425, partial [Flavitalea sp.]
MRAIKSKLFSGFLFPSFFQLCFVFLFSTNCFAGNTQKNFSITDDILIKGKVTVNGKGIAGVSVQLKNTKTGKVTNDNG